MITLDSFSNIHSLRYADETGLRIDLMCNVEGIGTDIPFTAAADDTEEHGRQLFQNAAAGEYGPVTPFSPPPVAEVAYQARRIRNRFIRASDPLVITDYTIKDAYLTTEQREELFATRLNFKSWPSQPGWPHIPLPAVPQWISDELLTRGYAVPIWPQ